MNKKETEVNVIDKTCAKIKENFKNGSIPKNQDSQSLLLICITKDLIKAIDSFNSESSKWAKVLTFLSAAMLIIAITTLCVMFKFNG